MDLLKSLTATAERRITLALLLFLLALYIPFAGNYGLWDPWETHYSEVARQMLMRHDYVSLWWPGSPQDRNEFWSKPVLTFWLMAIGMTVAGLENTYDKLGHAQHAFDGEMARGWSAEWAVRVPFILCGILCVWAVFELVRRTAGRRAALWSAILLATSSQFFYVTRQAMTDMAFVAPIAVALALAGLAVIRPREEMDAELPRRRWGALSWPHVPSFYALVGVLLATMLPQFAHDLFQPPVAINLGRRVLRMAFIVEMLPWIGLLVAYLALAVRIERRGRGPLLGAGLGCRRQVYLHLAFLMCGLSTLAKGPAGIGLPVIVLFFYLLVRGEFRRMLPAAPDPASGHFLDRTPSSPVGRAAMWALRFVAKNPLEVGLGTVLFFVVAAPWYHGMLVKHGMGFWNEFIGDNYVHRAAGRHGDRGTFEYYILQIGQGMFPWTAFVAAGLLTALARMKGDDDARPARSAVSEANDGRASFEAKRDERTRLRVFALVWTLVMFTVMSLVNTKFHHYIVPALPALAILGGLLLDDLFEAPQKGDALALLLAGLPALVLAARDLAMFPARLLWLFCYDYVNAPNGGRPWPSPAEWGSTYEYGTRIAAFGVVACAATLAFGLVALVRSRRATPERPNGDDAAGLSPRATWLLALIPIVTTVVAQVWEPAFGDGTPKPLANGWILVAAATGLFLVLLIGRGLADRRGVGATLTAIAVGAVACAWTAWGLDRMLTDVSPHWSQKHVIAAYYQQRKDESEPLIAWQMYWRGENFYTKNAIYDHHLEQKEKTVFLGDHNAEKLQEYFKTHAGRRVFFIVERTRFEALRALLPEAARPTLQPVDKTNNKVYLAVAQI